MIDKNYEELYLKFQDIKRKGWIKSMRRPPTGIGYTFETLINKEEDHTEFPDFRDIEIKTMNYYSKMPIHLFCLTPDGDYLFPIKRIIDTLGYPDKDYPQFKVINVNINALDYKQIGNKKVKLGVSWENQKIILDVKTLHDKKINLDVSWSFESIEERINLKIKKLAIIKAFHKKYYDDDYYNYFQFDYYYLKSFNNFIKLIENGAISISLHIGIQKNEKYLGQLNDRGSNFNIMEKDLEKLFIKA